MSGELHPAPSDQKPMPNRAGPAAEPINEEQLRDAVLALSAEIAGCQTVDELCRVVVEGIRARMGIDRAGLFLSDPVDPRFHGTYGTDCRGHTTDEHHYFWDIRRERDIEELFQGLPFKSGFRLGNPEPSPEEERDGVHSHLIALRRSGVVFGIISVDNRISRRLISEAQLIHISLLAEVLGNAMQAAGARSQLNDSLERLRRANEELEKFNRAMVGRENRIIALKDEINECLKELGRPPRYPAIWNESADATTIGEHPA